MDYNTEYQNEKDYKKRLIAPFVLLLLCMMAFTGLAYAYSSDYVLHDNPVTVERFMLVQTDGEGMEIDTVISNDVADFDIYTKKTDGNVKMYSGGSEFKREFYITVVTDKDCQFTIHAEFVGDSVTDKLFTINNIEDIVVDGNTETKIVATFTPLVDVDLSTVGLTTDTTVKDNLVAVQSEINSHTLTLTVTATPVE